MSRLDQLDILSRKLLAGKLKGERRSKRRGQSVEFADYRNYVVGDDLRFIDWNIYARLDKLFLKLFLEEEDLSLFILVGREQELRLRHAEQGCIHQAGGRRAGVRGAGELQPRSHRRGVGWDRGGDRRNARPATRRADDRLHRQAEARGAEPFRRSLPAILR